MAIRFGVEVIAQLAPHAIEHGLLRLHERLLLRDTLSVGTHGAALLRYEDRPSSGLVCANLAAGILVLKPGEEDTQTPHDSDEVYYILKGNGYLKIKNKDYKISEGKVFFVRKDLEHYFFGNTKELVVLYFFGGQDS